MRPYGTGNSVLASLLVTAPTRSLNHAASPSINSGSNRGCILCSQDSYSAPKLQSSHLPRPISSVATESQRG